MLTRLLILATIVVVASRPAAAQRRAPVEAIVQAVEYAQRHFPQIRKAIAVDEFERGSDPDAASMVARLLGYDLVTLEDVLTCEDHRPARQRECALVNSPPLVMSASTDSLAQDAAVVTVSAWIHHLINGKNRVARKWVTMRLRRNQGTWSVTGIVKLAET